MEISNEGTGQYFLTKLNVRKIEKNPMENVSYIKTITAKERHSRLHSHRYIIQYTALYTCRIMLYCDRWNIGTKWPRHKSVVMFHKIRKQRIRN